MKKFVMLTLSLALWGMWVNGQIISEFTSDADNWHSEGDGNYYWEAANGNPDGCFRVDDDATGDWNNAFAPVKFLGDWSAATTSDYLSADIFVHQYSGSYSSGTFVFQISGPGGTARAFTPVSPPLDVWNTYTANLDPANWVLVSGDWNLLLQQVTELIVRAEYINGDEFVRIDNVILSITPTIIPVTPVICSDFEDGGYDGWSFMNTGGVSNYSTGGNPGRCLRITDGSGISMAYPPPKYLGDWTQLDNHAADIRMDIKITNYSGSFLSSDYFIKISGPGGVAKFPFPGDFSDALNQYNTFFFPLDQSYWIMESGTWTGLINHVNSFEIQIEFMDASEIVWLDNFCITDLPPIADFSADVTTSFVGNPVHFTDLSTQGPQTWNWTFGDSHTSSDRNPVHTYLNAGMYDVSLTATNYFGSDTETKPAFIEVLPIDQCLKFQDNFDDNTIGNAWWLKNGTWSEASGNIRQTSNFYTSNNLLEGCFSMTGSLLWQNYVVSCDLLSSDNDDIGLVFNWQDEQNMYMFDWNLQGNYRRIIKWVNGVQNILASDGVGYVTNQWYNVMIYSNNGKLVLTIDGIEIFNVDDNTFTTGKAGLFCSGNQSSYWDNFKVECPGTPIQLKAFIEGPFSGSQMNTTLLDNNLLDLSNPYGASPWNHPGTEGVLSFENPDVVDWVLVDFRDALDAVSATPATSIDTKACLLMRDGSIESPYSGLSLYLNSAVNNNLFVVLYHRNHLGIMSAVPLTESGGVYSYDFSTGAAQAYGTNSQKDLGGGIYGMYAGDFNADGTVNADDKTNNWSNSAGAQGYLQTDGNLDGQSDNLDKHDWWLNNTGRSTQVPQ